MFFFGAKLFWALAQPITLGIALLLAGTLLLWTRWHRLGRALVTLVSLAALAVLVLPLGEWLIAPLENRFAAVADPGEPVHGAIVLGGAANLRVSADRGQITLGDAAERLTALVGFARRYPEARIVFSGGSGDALDQRYREADLIPRFLEEQGVDPGRVILERESRNTWENAVFTLELVGRARGERWLLITSASHMPRAMGCFRRAGAELVPYPVDFRTSRKASVLGLQPRDTLDLLTDATREWIGLLAYWVSDRIPTLFPGPRNPQRT